MTEEELDALIAERMKRLPDWWNGDCSRESKRSGKRLAKLLLHMVHDRRR